MGLIAPRTFEALLFQILGLFCRWDEVLPIEMVPRRGTVNGTKGKVTVDSEAQFPSVLLSLSMAP